MIRKIVIPLVALAGVILAVFTVVKGSKQLPPAAPAAEPSLAPYKSYVAGAGLVEARSENILIGTIVPGVVLEVYVKPGDRVKKGDKLWLIDDRDVRAQLAVEQAALDQALAKQHKLAQGTRPEEVPPAEAQVKADEAALADAKEQLKRYEAVSDSRAVSEDDITHRRFLAQQSEARLAQSRANLALLKAGTWQEDLTMASADVGAARAALHNTQTLLDRLTVAAPVDGKVLQVKIHPGEYAPAGVTATPLMVLGNVDTLVVRTDVDENDAWRVHPGAKAVAYLRGNKDIGVELRFYRIEPFVIPKKSLTGDSTERVDTRVLQALYEFDRGEKPIYVGQQMDVFIDAPPVGGDGANGSGATQGGGAAGGNNAEEKK